MAWNNASQTWMCPQSTRGPHEQADSDSVGLEWGLRACVSSTFPSDADTAGLWTSLYIGSINRPFLATFLAFKRISGLPSSDH